MFITCLFAFCTTFAVADDFSALWKLVDEAYAKDHPQTEMQLLRKIASKAAQKKAYGHLLKAEFRYAARQVDISPDSLSPVLNHLNAMREKAYRQQPALAAIYATLLSKIYSNNAFVDETYQAKAQALRQEALRDIEILSKTRSDNYQPAVLQGIDSQYFNNDLLHLIAAELSEYELMFTHYLAEGNNPAACLAAAIWWENVSADNKQLPTLDSLIQKYADLPVAGELAIAKYQHMNTASAKEKLLFIDQSLQKWPQWERMNILKNARVQITCPRYLLHVPDTCIIPQSDFQVYLNNICHLGELQVNIYSTSLSGDYDERTTPPGPNFKHGPLVKTYKKDYAYLPEYEEISDSIQIEGLPVGVYLIETTTDTKEMDNQYALLYISNLTLVAQQLPNKQLRILSLNATTGNPVPHASLQIKSYKFDKQAILLTTNEQGELIYINDDERPLTVYLTTNDDKAFRPQQVSAYLSQYSPRPSDFNVSLFTDRSIYRPGQTLHVAAIVYRNHDVLTSETIASKELTLILRDANNQEVAKKNVTTDEFGKAATTFSIPSSGLTGHYSISTETATIGFQVDEYKRPTFHVELENLSPNYAAGDTITLRGTAKNYSDVPVQHAKVKYSVTREIGLWWHRIHSQESILTGEVTTDDNGSFSLRLPLNVDSPLRNYEIARFSVSAIVTNLAGESHETNETILLSNRTTFLQISIPDKILVDSLPAITFEYKNIQSQDIDAEVKYSIDGETWTARTNRPVPFPMPKIKSGIHLLRAICHSDTLQKEFVVFSLEDRRPPIETPDWFYVSDNEFPANGKPVNIQIGTTQAEQYVAYTILAKDTIITQGNFTLNNSNRLFSLPYKSTYGNAVCVSFAWVKQGKSYTHTVTLLRNLPTKKLQTRWTTFRDQLIPGQQETWTLEVLNPDGTSAAAQLMAVLYDYSLDQIHPHAWFFSPEMPRGSIYSPFRPANHYGFHLNAYQKLRYKTVRNLDIDNFDPSLTAITAYPRIYIRGRNRLMMQKNETMLASALTETDHMDFAAATNELASISQNPSANKESVHTDKKQIRENLSETAFFYPQLLSDKNGNINIQFTLPEAVTTWNFIGLAHDKKLNYNIFNAQVVARKNVTIKPNLPRFLRKGDKAVITSEIFNTTDAEQKGIAQIEFINPSNLEILFTQRKPVTLAPQQTDTVSFAYSVFTDEPLLICKITIQGADFSDGEQQYLPILSNKELITNTHTFTLSEQGSYNFDLSALNTPGSTLTLEYTSNPAWLMIQSLLVMATPQSDNALSIAQAFYANRLAMHIATLTPQIKQICEIWKQEQGEETSLTSSLLKNSELKNILLNETPWLQQAISENQHHQELLQLFDQNLMQQRLQSATEKLRNLQLSDGSWSWWKGMEGSYYITAAISELLTRLLVIVGHDADTQALLDRAVHYMEQQMIAEMNLIKQQEKHTNQLCTPSQTTIHLLYIDAIHRANLSPQGKVAKAFMIKRFKKTNQSFSIYQKALAAVILAKNNYSKLAADYISSLQQYLVYKPEIGLYYDTPKATYAPFNQRLSTQVAVIEALQLLKSLGSQHTQRNITQMQQYLLSARRTQLFDNPVATVNTISAFVNQQTHLFTSTNNYNPLIKIDNQPLKPSTSPALGYLKQTLPHDKIKQLTIEKNNNNLSWGTIYSQTILPTDQVQPVQTGIQLKREIISQQPLTLGSKIKIRITITADRDYHFLQVEDCRPACLESVQQTSTYQHGIYITPRDTSTRYYFNQISKGTHTIETEYYISHTGQYKAGICTAQCAYAPEFNARTNNYSITIN